MCTTSGSRPPATVTWWRNDQHLLETKETVSTNQHLDTSKTIRVVGGDSVGYSLAGRKSKSTLLNQRNISPKYILVEREARGEPRRDETNLRAASSMRIRSGIIFQAKLFNPVFSS